MRESDLVIMTSISEGFPMSVLEALSQARPVVTTSVGGVLDAMRGAGLTAPAGDVFGLSDAVTTLLLNEDLAERLGRRGHARVSRLFAQGRCLSAYDSLLRAAAAPAESRAPVGPPVAEPAVHVPVLAPVFTAARAARGAAAGVRLAARSGPASSTAPRRVRNLSLRRYGTGETALSGRPKALFNKPTSSNVLLLMALAMTVLLAAGLTFIGRDAPRHLTVLAVDSADSVLSADLPRLSHGSTTSKVSFKSDLSVRASIRVRLDAPVRHITLSVPDSRNIAGGIFQPRVSDIRISLGNGLHIPVPETLAPGAIRRIDLPEATDRFRIDYRADDAIVPSEPSTVGRAAALATPLQVRVPVAMMTTLRLMEGSVMNIGCSYPGGAAEACGRTASGGWMVTHEPEEQDVAVLAQLDLDD
jgi:hypothetical protein